MQIALIQVAYYDDEPLAEKTDRVLHLVRSAPAADLYVLPELWGPGAFNPHLWPSVAEPVPGPLTHRFSALAQELNATIHAGSVVEQHQQHRYNTSVLIGPDGQLCNTYRKIHRFGFSGGETEHISAGDALATGTHTFAGREYQYALATCYDVRFPELFRLHATTGTELLVVTAAWPKQRRHAWRTLLQARAIENQCFVAATNTAGRHGNQNMAGSSMIVAPDGQILADAGAGEEIVHCSIDPIALTALRTSFPVLADQRFGIHPTAKPVSAPDYPTLDQS